MSTLSRNAEVLKFFAEKGAGLGLTRLQKLAYLADLESRKVLGHPISEFRYLWYNHGPFDKALYTAREELVRKGFAEPEEGFTLFGNFERRTLDTGREVVYSFTPAEREILEYVARVYLSTNLTDTLAHVYATEPMRAATRGQPIPMELVDRRDRDAIGFDLEEVIAAERDIEQGNYTLASDFFNGLRAQISAGRPLTNH